ncbi:MarR family transcriptional regulator [Vibrio pectenicida]|uniref:MarR family transcriptional regulator n=1 Tax=Vibrio pectenicida TaxID=62763 RepID=A0A7Y4EFW8_9VIBR|nr:MarR family transcriptional regulator [Vibrio pectenicida]NOH72831.1 MarR family transcriptional regulator [Vibrio pectenicida]
MRLAHKRKVQMKLQKRIKETVAKVETPKEDKPLVEKKIGAAPAKKKVGAGKDTNASLTPKQKQVLEIVAENADGINPKGIGLAAGQEEAKAASWASTALKKLLEENLVAKEQLAGNKVIYKPI